MMTIPLWQAVPWHEPPLREERIQMIDYAPVQAQGKGDAPTINRKGGGQETAKALNKSPLPTVDGVDKLYHQLVEIHAIAAAQLAECAH
jgi:hypothetical protein